MIAQISSPIRALIFLLTIIASLYILLPYASPRSASSFNRWRVNNATATEIPPDVLPAKAPQNAIPPSFKSPVAGTPKVADNHISGDLTDDADEGGPRVRQTTMLYETGNFNAIYERSVDTHIKHGEKWGVSTHVLRRDVIEAGFFNKPAYILGLMIEEMAKPDGKRAGWIVWFDADTILLNDAVPWTLFLPPSDFDEIHLLASQDQNGFNAGMAIFRVSQWSVQMLAETLAVRQLVPGFDTHIDDQGALRWVMERQGYAEHVIYQPHSWWNSFGLNSPPYDTEAFMLHFAGADCCGQEESKGTVMGRWLDIVENNPQQYAMELEKTKLPKEVEDYWALLRKAKKTMKHAHDAEPGSRALQTAQNELWGSYSLRGDNATEVSIGIKKVEDIMAQIGVEPGKPSKEEALKKAETKQNAEDKAKQTAQAKEESAKKAEEARKDDKPAGKEAASEKKEEVAAKKEAVEANKQAAHAEEEKAAAKKEAAAPAKKNR